MNSTKATTHTPLPARLMQPDPAPKTLIDNSTAIDVKCADMGMEKPWLLALHVLPLVEGPTPSDGESKVVRGHGGRDDVIQEFADHLRVEHLRERTIHSYARHAERFIEWLADQDAGDYRAASKGTVYAYFRYRVQNGWSPGTHKQAHHALVAFYNWAVGPKESPMVGLHRPSVRHAVKEAYSDADADRIIAVAAQGSSVNDRFDYMVLMLLRHTGVRASELVGIKTADIDLDTRKLSVVGKGNKRRTIPISKPLATALTTYLAEVRPELPDSEYLLANPRSLGNVGRTNTQAVAWLTEKYHRLAGAHGDHNPHKHRHTFATSMLRRGADVTVVQRIMGHASISTTAIYLHLVDDDLQEAVDRVFGD